MPNNNNDPSEPSTITQIDLPSTTVVNESPSLLPTHGDETVPSPPVRRTSKIDINNTM